MVTISLCMIVKNEEEVLSRCLDSIADAVDEIIIADTGSSDKTKEIARKYTEKVFDFAWIDDFSAARNFAYSKASMDYQMWMDADDILPETEKEKLIELKRTLDPKTDMVTMQYYTQFDSNDKPVFTFSRERLTKREKGYLWQDPVHECIPLSGNIVNSDIAFHHRKPPSKIGEVSTRNLDIYENLEASQEPFTPRQLYYFARELNDHMKWAKAAYYFNRFLETGLGQVDDNIAACFNLAFCYGKLGENEKVLPCLLYSFHFGSPRAEICCSLGYFYKEKQDYKTALAWFHMATQLDIKNSNGFILRDYWGYIPNIECCVCCCNIGKYDEAHVYNEKAAKYKSDNASVIHNRKYLLSLKNKKV